eukprot:gene25334-31778_t
MEKFQESRSVLKVFGRMLVHRIDEAGILDYNLTIGEAWIKGGFLLIGPNEGIVYQHAEMTGSELPLEDIEQA